MVPSLRFIYHEDVRSSAAQALPALLGSCTAAAKQGRAGASATSAKQLLDFMLQPLLDAAAKVRSLSWAVVPVLQKVEGHLTWGRTRLLQLKLEPRSGRCWN